MSRITLKQYLNSNKRFWKESYKVNKEFGMYDNKEDYISRKTKYILDLVANTTLSYDKTLPNAQELIRASIEEELEEE